MFFCILIVIYFNQEKDIFRRKVRDNASTSPKSTPKKECKYTPKEESLVK